MWQGVVAAGSDVQDEQGLGVHRVGVESNQEEGAALLWAGGGGAHGSWRGNRERPHGPGQAALHGTVPCHGGASAKAGLAQREASSVA